MLNSLFAVFLIALGSGLTLCSRPDEVVADRWEADIQRIEKTMREKTPPLDGVLFVGSSSIRLWKLEESFPDISVANHGFGGSQLSDSVKYFERIVSPLRPREIVVYAGDNDIAGGKSPEQVHADFLEFVGKVREQLPECRKVIYIAVKPSTKRWHLAEQMQEANRLISETCAKHDVTAFVDIWSPMLRSDGTPNPDLLVEDGLHLSVEGYELWTRLVRERLTRKI